MSGRLPTEQAMELNEALSQISEIRRQMARGETFRGYRSATTAFSGCVAVAASLVHWHWKLTSLNAYLELWLVAAGVSLTVVAIEMIIRCYKSESSLQQEMTQIAVEQFVPCLVAGGFLTYVMLHYAWQSFWLMPGLWAILFAMGIFSSRRVLPKGTGAVGGWYLLSGLLCIVIPSRQPNMWPWEMALCFGVGQFLAAFVLYWNLERRHGE
jgi:small neutral amino acid transporter SnatA (MarC family)